MALPWVFFAGGFFSGLLGGVFYRAVFRSGDIHGFIPVNFSRAFFCRGHFRALFRSGFSVRFFRVVSVHFSTEPFCVRSLAQSFLWAFSQGFPPCILSHGRFQSTFSKGRFQCALSSETFWCTFFRGFLRAFSIGEEFNALHRGGLFGSFSHGALLLCTFLQGRVP